MPSKIDVLFDVCLGRNGWEPLTRLRENLRAAFERATKEMTSQAWDGLRLVCCYQSPEPGELYLMEFDAIAACTRGALDALRIVVVDEMRDELLASWDNLLLARS